MKTQPNHAFTLIELLVTLAILGLLTTIAYPTYQGQMIKTRRNDAKQSLLWMVQQMERCYSRYRSYKNIGCDLLTNGTAVAKDSRDGYYRIASKGPSTAETLTDQGFVLYATPQPAGSAKDSQHRDTLCALWSLDNHMGRGARNSAGQDTADRCW